MDEAKNRLKKNKTKQNKVVIVALIFLVLFFVYKVVKATRWQIWNREKILSVEIDCCGTKQEIRPYELNDVFFFFLPDSSTACSLTLNVDSRMIITFNGSWVHNGTSLSKLERDTEYSVRINGVPLEQVVFMYGDHLPSVFISTESGGIEWLRKNKENKESGNMTLVDSTGKVQYDDELKWISGRGNQTWEYEKKPWTIKLSEEASLLGMNSSDKWVLLANVLDDTVGLRNYIAYNMASKIGLEYSRNLHFVNLYMNGEYYGLYLLGEKIEISDNDINIGNLEKRNKKKNPEIFETEQYLWREESSEDGTVRRYAEIDSPGNITGGYILERSYGYKLTNKESWFITPGGEGFVIRDPSIVSKEESVYISDTVNTIERALSDSAFTDQQTGENLLQLIDADSWVLKYLVDEVTKNKGAGATSSYFYKKQNNRKIFAGPVWDYDKSLGNSGYWKSPDGLTLCNWHDVTPSDWWTMLYENEEIKALIKEYYSMIVRPYIQQQIREQIDDSKGTIESSYKMDYCRWEAMLRSNKDSYGADLVYHLGDFQGAVDYLKDWLEARLQFLDSVWLNGKEYYNLFITKSDNDHEYYAIPKDSKPSEAFWDSVGSNAAFYESASEELYDIKEQIAEDLWLYVSNADN